MVVQAEATGTRANTGGMLKSVGRKSTTVLSDRICSFVAIDDGSSEQQCRIDINGK